MNLFDKLVQEAIKNQPALAPLKVVVEKELLHHDILRIMRDSKLITGLTFIGGTCLRACYGGVRLSEDLDFTGGNDFSKVSLATLSKVLIKNLQAKYGLQVSVTEPIKDTLNVDTWKIKVQTRTEAKSLPAQRINIDICSVPSYDVRPMTLLNFYGVDMGTSGLVLKVQSKEEIFTDKLLAFALRPNRIKYRDLWDLMWLHGQALKPKIEFIPKKLVDRNVAINHFLNLFDLRVKLMKESLILEKEFRQEMQRFLPKASLETLNQNDFWNFIRYLLENFAIELNKNFR